MSDLSRWPEAEALLDRVLELRPEQRGAYMDSEVRDPELRAALDAILAEADDDFLEPAGALNNPVFQDLESGLEDESPALPRRVGAYRLTREIGRGGMARVFEAERVDGGFSQKVAVKLVRRAERRRDVYERFEQERQILANLRHRSIAHLYEGGKTEDGEPYFVMELIDGESIEAYCRRTAADLGTRIRLFLDVAEAVGFAHRNLVVHRDIKSSNVLVDRDQQVKLLDFGIARLIEATPADATVTGQRMLTPEYASPEQLQGAPVTTASDVYQMGHLLYRLLSERSPYRGRTATPAYLQEAILTDTPVLPSVAAAIPAEDSPSWAGSLRGDLDAVVMKALRKEPERRYATVQELIDDLRAFLAGRPVRARPDSSIYRVRKFVQRHRAVTAISAVTLILLIALSSTFTARLAGERDRARASAQRAEAVTGFLEQLFTDANPNNSGRSDLSARELIERAPQRIEDELRDQPQVQSLLYGLAGRLIGDLGDERQSEAWISRSLELADESGPQGVPSRIVALRSLAGLRIDQHREEEAFELLDRAERHFEGSEPGAWIEKARLVEARARALSSLGRYDEALEHYASAERLLDSPESTDRRFLLEVRYGFAKASRLSKRDPDRAIALLEKSVEEHKRFYGEDHPRLLNSIQDLAAAYGSRAFDAREEDENGEIGLAQIVLRPKQGLAKRDISTRHFGVEHPNRARIFLLQGAVAYAEKDWDGVRSRYAEAVRIFEALSGYEDDAALASTYLGVADLKSGRYEAAIPIFERVIRAFGRSTSRYHWRVAGVYYYLGESYYELERWESSRINFEEAFTRYVESNGPDHPRTQAAQAGLADCHLRLAEGNLGQGRPREAATHLDRAQELFQSIPDRLNDDRRARIDRLARGLH